MNTYDVWWRVTNSGDILHITVVAASRKDAEDKVLSKYGYSSWDIKFTKTEIVFVGG